MDIKCKKNTACISYEKDMTVIVDTCIIGNIIKAIINIMEEYGYEEVNKFDIFCGLLKIYLTKMRLCPLNHTLYTTTNIYNDEMDLNNSSCVFYNIDGLKDICGNEHTNYVLIKQLLESNITYKKYSISDDKIKNFRIYIKNKYHRHKELSDNDISLIIISLELINEKGKMVLTDDIKIIDVIDIFRANKRYKFNKKTFDSSNIHRSTSLSYLGNIYFCCELFRNLYENLFKIRETYIRHIYSNNPHPNITYEKEVEYAYRIISRPDKPW
jgi:hypothetical protein